MKEYYQHDSEEGRHFQERVDFEESLKKVWLIVVGIVGVFGAIRYWFVG